MEETSTSDVSRRLRIRLRIRTLLDISEGVGAGAAGDRAAEPDKRAEALEEGAVDTMGDLRRANE